MHHASAPSSPGTCVPTVGPPSSGGVAPLPGATVGSPLRRTAIVRPTIVPVLLQGAFSGFAPSDPYVRTFWIPIVGTGAVADLLRLTTAARGGRPLKLPVHTPLLVREGLARWDTLRTVAVGPVVPLLTKHQVRRLPPDLRAAHTAHTRQTATTAGVVRFAADTNGRHP